MKKVVYQIYPVSFNDTTGSGTGDLKGIKEKLPYLKNLGVDYIWITPFFKSPFNDNGYDISDYYDVDPIFGTNNDLKELLKEAKKNDLKIMLDMVFNHTSTSHTWFKKWLSGDPEYKDFYISKKSKGKPPTNWKSKFGGSSWENYKENDWYLHLFDVTQADLNWENPLVREKLKEVIHYYIDLGVKGFRFDVINLISKSVYQDDFDGDGRKFYTDGPKVHQFIQEISNEFPKDDLEFLTVGELSSTTIEDTIQYANKNKTELDSVFTFHHLKIDHDGINKFANKEPDIKKLNEILAQWVTSVSGACSTMANFLTNHDQPRAVSRFIDKKYKDVGAKMLFALTSTLPGIPYIYQGEEIAMENIDFKTFDDFRDVESINYLKLNNLKEIPLGLRLKSRDNSRSPMQWDSSINSGFSVAKPWIKVNENFKTVNVAKQERDKGSVLSFYKEQIEFIKSEEIFEHGVIKFLPFKNNMISFELSYKTKKYQLAFSFNNKVVSYIFDGKIIRSNYGSQMYNKLQPYEFVIMEANEKSTN